MSAQRVAARLPVPAIVCATLVVLGRQFGYTAVRDFLGFWTVAVLVLVSAARLARMHAPDPPDLFVQTGVFTFATIVLIGLVLGYLGRFTFGRMLFAQLACAGMLIFLGRGLRQPRSQPSVPVPGPAAGVMGAMLVFIVAYGLSHAPLTLYDSVSYHLFFAGRWVQDHAITIIPTPFSDEAQAYAPGNGELFFAWLMLPFHGDFLARIGQLPFALLAALTLYAIAKRLGADPEQAAFPAALFLVARPVVEQAGGANVDLVCAAMFLVTLYAGLVAVDRNTRADWTFWGIAFGLFLGTKYLALVYAPVLIALALAGGFHKRMLFALPGIATLGLPWYLRNWIVAGSPIYPASLTLGGVTLARGAFTRAAMVNTIFHTSDLRLLPTMLAHALGPALAIVWLPLAIAGVVRLLRRGLWPWGAVALTAPVMTVVYWFGLPVNIDSRFLMPAVAPALLPLAFTFGDSRRWIIVRRAVSGGAIAWVLAGANFEIPAHLPWFMSGWLALDGIVTRDYLIWFGGIAVMIAAAWRLTARATRWTAPLVATLCALATATLVAGRGRWCPQTGCNYLNTTSPFIRPNLLEAWEWTDDQISGSTVAYTGINLPYPLSGRKLTNRVVYANIDGRPSWRFHDYDRAYRARRFDPQPPLLAVSSGELMPVAVRTGPRSDAVRPRYERMQGLRDAWVDNLQRLRVDYLFVSSLSAYEIDYVWHNEGGFPIEDEWARSDPRAFRLVYENLQVRIYRVDLRSEGRA
jgi:hypothetical protein